MGGLTHDQFRFRIDRPNAAHVAATGRGVEMINHDYHTVIVRRCIVGKSVPRSKRMTPPVSPGVGRNATTLHRVSSGFYVLSSRLRFKDLTADDLLQKCHVASRITRSRRSYSGSRAG